MLDRERVRGRERERVSVCVCVCVHARTCICVCMCMHVCMCVCVFCVFCRAVFMPEFREWAFDFHRNATKHVEGRSDCWGGPFSNILRRLLILTKGVYYIPQTLWALHIALHWFYHKAFTTCSVFVFSPESWVHWRRLDLPKGSIFGCFLSALSYWRRKQTRVSEFVTK